MNIRLKYTKIGDIRYISHLDVVKMMERLFRRAQIAIAYSEGFNPHPKMSFSPALQLGVESLCEYIDIEMKEEISVPAVIEQLNLVSVFGVRFIDGCILPEKPGSIVAFLSHSDYEAKVELDQLEDVHKITKAIRYLNESEEISLSKKSKKGNLSQYNLKEFVGLVRGEQIPQGINLCFTVCSGSVKSLNPKIVLEQLLHSIDPESYLIQLRKVDTYHMDEETWQKSSPLEHQFAVEAEGEDE